MLVKGATGSTRSYTSAKIMITGLMKNITRYSAYAYLKIHDRGDMPCPPATGLWRWVIDCLTGVKQHAQGTKTNELKTTWWIFKWHGLCLVIFFGEMKGSNLIVELTCRNNKFSKHLQPYKSNTTNSTRWCVLNKILYHSCVSMYYSICAYCLQRSIYIYGSWKGYDCTEKMFSI